MSEPVHIVCPHCHAINRVPAARLAEGPRCGACHRPILDGAPVELDVAHFRTHVTRNDLPVLVDFWAPWCGPCRMMAPIFAQAAHRYGTRMRFAKVNTEAQPALAAEYGIRSIPTLVLFRSGREVDRVMGALPPAQLEAWIERYL